MSNLSRSFRAVLAVAAMFTLFPGLVSAQMGTAIDEVKHDTPVKTKRGPKQNGITMNTNSASDFNGDRMSDLVYFAPDTSEWYVFDLAHSTLSAVTFGAVGGTPMAADYDGDRVMDIAMARSDNGLMCWEIKPVAGDAVSLDWGLDTDIPVKGDFDGDGKTDPAVMRFDTGQWLIRASSTGALIELQLAPDASDIPVPGDYDGDGRTDPAVFRGSENTFYYLSSLDQSLHAQGWEPINQRIGATFVPADYDGDGKTDFAVYTPFDGEWRMLLSSTGDFTVDQMPVNSHPCDIHGSGGCVAEDLAQPSDMDNDGVADPTIWTPRSGKIFSYGSTSGAFGSESGPFGGMNPVSVYAMTE